MTCLIEEKKRSNLLPSNNLCLLVLAVLSIIIVAATTSSRTIVVPFAMVATTSGVGVGTDDVDIDIDGDASRSSSFVGKWKLKEIWDDSDDDKPRKLPDNDGKPFILTFDEPTTTTTKKEGGRSDDNDDDSKILNLYIKIGNSMRTSVKFLDNVDNNSSSRSSSSKIQIGLVMSSRMYPGEELMGLENYLSTYLPQMKFIETKQSLLIMTTTTTTAVETTDDGSNDNGSKISGGGGGGERQAKIICEALGE